MEQEGNQNSLRKEGCGVGRVLIYACGHACGTLCDDRQGRLGWGLCITLKLEHPTPAPVDRDMFHHTRLLGISGMPLFKKADISEKAEQVLDISPWCRTRSHGTLGKIMMSLKSFCCLRSTLSGIILSQALAVLITNSFLFFFKAKGVQP